MTIPFKMFCWKKSTKNKWNAVNRFKSATKSILTDVSICEHGSFMKVLSNLGSFQIRIPLEFFMLLLLISICFIKLKVGFPYQRDNFSIY